MVITSISNLELIHAISELIPLIFELILTQIWVSISSHSISRILAVLAEVANTGANTVTSVHLMYMWDEATRTNSSI